MPMLQTLFNNVANREPNTGEIFKIIYFEEHQRTTSEKFLHNIELRASSI